MKLSIRAAFLLVEPSLDIVVHSIIPFPWWLYTFEVVNSGGLVTLGPRAWYFGSIGCLATGTYVVSPNIGGIAFQLTVIGLPNSARIGAWRASPIPFPWRRLYFYAVNVKGW